MSPWNPAEERPKVERVWVRDVEVKAGTHVRLQPRGRADILDMALEGMTATVATIEQDFEGRVYVVVTVDDDPGKDLGTLKKPAHRFFFRPDEVVPFGPD